MPFSSRFLSNTSVPFQHKGGVSIVWNAGVSAAEGFVINQLIAG